MVDEAGAAGGGAEPRRRQDHGFMYGRSFEDPDGHIWEPMWMDMAALGDRMPAEAARPKPPPEPDAIRQGGEKPWPISTAS